MLAAPNERSGQPEVSTVPRVSPGRASLCYQGAWHDLIWRGNYLSVGSSESEAEGSLPQNPLASATIRKSSGHGRKSFWSVHTRLRAVAQGPWSDGSKEWTTEVQQELDHSFGNWPGSPTTRIDTGAITYEVQRLLLSWRKKILCTSL
jgi:hypothetical protein